MISQLFTILHYYRTFATWSIAINILLLVFGSLNILVALITKLFLIVLLWYIVNQTEAKQKLTFYKNLGVSDFKLFGIVYCIDAIITVVFLSLINQFI